MELNSVLDLIHNRILPASEFFATEGTEKITEEVLAKLDNFHSDIKQLIREIHKEIIKAQSEKIRARVNGLSSLPVLVTSLLYGNVPGAILSGITAATSLHSHMDLTNVIGELESLQNEGQQRLNEIHEYRFLLQEKLTAAKYSLMSHLLVFIFVIVLFSVVLANKLAEERQVCPRKERVTHGPARINSTVVKHEPDKNEYTKRSTRTDTRCDEHE